MDALKEKRDAVTAAFASYEAALRAVEGAGEDADTDALTAAFDEARSAYKAAQERLAAAVELDEARKALPVEPVKDTPEKSLEVREGVKVTRSELTYEKNGQRSFVTDAFAAHRGDREAQERMAQHTREMEIEGRAINQTATSGGEFIPPLWLTNEWIAVPRPGRPVADSVHKLPLPPGTNSINLPKVSTGASAAVQSDGGTVSSTDLVTTSVTGQVQTVAGQQDFSQQLLDMSVPGIDSVIFDDLTREFDKQIDVKVIGGTVTNAKGITQVSSINTTTWTETTPSVATMYSKVAGAINDVNTNLYRPPSVIAMHPRRWAFLLKSLDSQNRPLVVPVGNPGFNAMGLSEKVAAQAIVGTLQGLPVILDANITTTNGASTNEDQVLIYSAQDLYLFESQPVFRVLSEVLSNTLQVRAQLYGYYAIIAGRLPKAISVISGTGLVAPTF